MHIAYIPLAAYRAVYFEASIPRVCTWLEIGLGGQR